MEKQKTLGKEKSLKSKEKKATQYVDKLGENCYLELKEFRRNICQKQNSTHWEIIAFYHLLKI